MNYRDIARYATVAAAGDPQQETRMLSAAWCAWIRAAFEARKFMRKFRRPNV